MTLFETRWTRTATAQFEELRRQALSAFEHRQQTGKRKSSRQEGLYRQIHKTIELLKANPRHPGLRTHEYDSLQHPWDPSAKVFEAYAQNDTPGAYRVFWCYGPGRNQITIIAITPHP